MALAAVLLFSSLILSAGEACAQSAKDDRASSSEPAEASGRPVPRFVSIRSAETNVRTGPGARYPVTWVLKKRSMPVEVIAEYDNWRKIRDWQGTEGWVNQALLSGRRFIVIHPSEAVLRISPDSIAAPVARLEAGVIARVESCRMNWCNVEAGKVEGWVSKDSIWGVYPDEIIDR